MIQFTIFDELNRLKEKKECARENSRLKLDSPTESIDEKKTVGESTIKTAKPFTRIYSPQGTARGSRKYFALNYKTKSGKRKDEHICGGNISSPIAQQKKKAIDDAIAQGTPINKLLEMCK
ncbi:MAG: hypothetical protein AAGA60_29230 [Cyanobacteria bacterium P01_E01_bin.42]